MRSALLVIFALFFILTPPVFAQEEQCGVADDELCYCDEQVVEFERCEPPTADTPATENSSAGTTITPRNWDASHQAVFAMDNAIDSGLGCFIQGDPFSDPVNPKDLQCPGDDPKTGQVMLYDKLPGGGALGGVSNLVLTMYTSPTLSSGEYLANIGENIGVKPAYAQVGTGNSSGDAVIKPVLKMWEIVRNMAYVTFIIVFVVVGFMIMLRSRINPQTVVTAQAAIPGLIIGLILVTFSYFIAALIVDLSFISMNLVVYLFSQEGITNAIHAPKEIGANQNVISYFWNFVFNGNTLGNLIGPIRDSFTKVLPGYTPTGGWLQNPVQYAIGASVGNVVGILITAIVAVAILIQMFRLLWALVQCYIAIFVTTIFGPFIILASSLPGRGGTLAVWWKSLLGNVLVFPAVFAAFLFAGVFLGTTNDNFQQTLPLFAGLPVELLRVVIAYGIILGTPAIPGMVKKALGVPDITGIPQAALQGIGLSAGAAQGGAGKLVQPWQQERQAFREASMRHRYPTGDAPISDNPFVRSFQPDSRRGIGGGGIIGGITRGVSRVTGWGRRP